jgi:AcrR family transcriptional regulator
VSPRPRKVSDDEVFAAAYRAMNRLGPSELTLAEVAAEAGVTAGALVQRFGSKHALMVALAEGVAATAGEFIRALGEKHESPLAAIRDYGDCMAQMAATPDHLVRSIQYLVGDLSDPDLRRHLLVQSRATRAGIRELLDAAVTRGELRKGTDTAKLARTLETVIGGSLLSWAVYREGAAKKWVREHVDAVLAPWLLTPRGARRRGSR